MHLNLRLVSAEARRAGVDLHVCEVRDAPAGGPGERGEGRDQGGGTGGARVGCSDRLRGRAVGGECRAGRAGGSRCAAGITP